MPNREDKRSAPPQGANDAYEELAEVYLQLGAPSAAEGAEATPRSQRPAVPRDSAARQVWLSAIASATALGGLALLLLYGHLPTSRTAKPVAAAGRAAAVATAGLPAGELPALGHLSLEPAWKGAQRMDTPLYQLNGQYVLFGQGGALHALDAHGADLAPYSGGGSIAALATDGANSFAVQTGNSFMVRRADDPAMHGGAMINTRSGSAPGTAELALAPERVYWAVDSADGPASFGARDIHGRPLWQQELPGQAVGVTALSETGVLVQTGPAAEAAWDQLRCYSPSGKPLWRGVLHIKSGSRPELASDGALYAVVPAASGLRGYDLARLNPADGSPLWRQPLGTTEEMKAFAMADGGVLAAGATLVRCGETGERNWELPADTLTLLPVAPVSVRGTDLALVRLGGRYGALAGRLALFEARTAAPGRVWLLSTDLRQPDSMAALGRTLLLGQRGQPPAAYRLPPLQEPAQLIAER